MVKRIGLFLLSVVLTINCLAGCARQETVVQIKPEPADTAVVSVTERLEADGKVLSIDTAVEVPDLDALEEVTMCFSEELLEKMVTELVHTQYPDLKEETMDGDRSWIVETPQQLLFSFSCEDSGFDAGRVHYLDVLRDLNGQDVEGDAQMRWTPYYITAHIPDKLELTPAEASEELCAFLKQYSCFDYETWNMVAVNCRQEANSPGYYQVMLMPRYDGMPVCIDSVPYISACMSAEGVFTFQGIMALKELSRQPVGETMSLEAAVERYKEKFLAESGNDKVTVNRISAGYVAESYYDETWVLSPSWIFESVVTSGQPDGGGEYVFYETDVYKMSDGSHFSF